VQHLREQISEATAHLRTVVSQSPQVGIILGSGLGGVAEALEVERSVDYQEIPHFLRPTAIGHRGRLLFGRFAGKRVVAMQGRYHLYEGHSAERVTFPVRVMRALGIELLVVSNAAGGLDPRYSAGDVMIIDDHVNLMNRNPLVGVNDDRLGPRFPDLSSPNDRAIGELAISAARRNDCPYQRGTYVGVLGPNYETRAEIRMLRAWGDAVGMSTVPEVIVAAHMGLRVLGLSIITNVCSPDVRHVANGEEVVAAANAASGRVQSLVKGVLASVDF
jgi:purine-nucleoside phosphorylase